MGSRYVSPRRGRKRSAPVRSERSQSNFHLSPSESKPELKGNFSTCQADTIEDFAKELEGYSQSQHCDVSQMMDCDLRRSFDYSELYEEKLDTSMNDIIDKEFEWHEQSLFDHPFTGEGLNNPVIPSVEPLRKKRCILV